MAKWINENRGVSSTVKLPVSKTGLGGSNPSAPARVLRETEDSGVEMAVETKKMSNLAAMGGNFGDQVKAWPERIKAFYNDVRSEMRKVTAPSLKEVRATTTVVVITVFIFGLYFAVIDYFIQHGVSYVFNYFKSH